MIFTYNVGLSPESLDGVDMYLLLTTKDCHLQGDGLGMCVTAYRRDYQCLMQIPKLTRLQTSKYKELQQHKIRDLERGGKIPLNQSVSAFRNKFNNSNALTVRRSRLCGLSLVK